MIGIFRSPYMLLAGSVLAGLGYGIMQPIIYDKAAVIAPPRLATLALSFVMAVNYLSVMVCPFIVDSFRWLLHAHGERFPFVFNAALTVMVFIAAWIGRNGYTFGLDRSYYGKKRN